LRQENKPLQHLPKTAKAAAQEGNGGAHFSLHSSSESAALPWNQAPV
jgi:hypothetical protein